MGVAGREDDRVGVGPRAIREAHACLVKPDRRGTHHDAPASELVEKVRARRGVDRQALEPEAAPPVLLRHRAARPPAADGRGQHPREPRRAMVVRPAAVVAGGERGDLAHRHAHRPRDRRELDRDVGAARARADDDDVASGERARVAVRGGVEHGPAKALSAGEVGGELTREQAGRDDHRVEQLAVDGPPSVTRSHRSHLVTEPNARPDAGRVGVALEIRDHVVARGMIGQCVVEGEIGERRLLLRRVRAERRVRESGVRAPDAANGARALEHDGLEPAVEQPARARQSSRTGADDRDPSRHGASIGRTLVG